MVPAVENDIRVKFLDVYDVVEHIKYIDNNIKQRWMLAWKQIHDSLAHHPIQ